MGKRNQHILGSLLLCALVFLVVSTTSFEPAVAAIGDVTIIYDDTLASGWSEAGFSRTFDPIQSAITHTGTQAIETTINVGGIVYLNYDNGANYPDGAVNSVRYWIHGGEIGGQVLKFSVLPAAYDFDSHAIELTLAAGWQQVEIPFWQLGSVPQVTGIAWKNVGTSTAGPIFIDDIEFVENAEPTQTPLPTETPSPTETPPLPTATSVPDGFNIVYADSLAENWVENGFSRTFDPNQTGTVYAGNRAIETTIEVGGIVYLNYDNGAAYPDSSVNSVSYWIHGGELGGQVLKFSVMPAAYDFDTHAIEITLAAGWQQIEVPFTQFGSVAQVTGLAWKNVGTSAAESLYLDEIVLLETTVPAETPTPIVPVTETPTPLATATNVPIDPLTIYDDILAADWAENGFSRTFNPNQSETVYAGSQAIETTISVGGIVYLNYNNGTAYPDSAINAVRYWIHGGPVGGQVLKFSVMPAAYDFDTHAVEVILTAGWQQIEVPFTQFGSVAQVTGLAWKNVGSSTAKSLFIDQIEFALIPVETATPTPQQTPSGPTPFPTLDPTDPTSDDSYRLSFSIDRTSVPELYYNDLTLKTYVGQATDVIVKGDGTIISATYSDQTGYVQYSTMAEQIEIDVIGGVDVAWLGYTEKMVLKDDKSWAWSHGFDDNVFLFPAIDLFKAKDWRATLYLIGSDVDDTRDEDWIVDAPAAQRLLTEGWSLGSHSWTNSCEDATEPEVQLAFDRLEDIAAASTKPDYKIIAFAAPCFSSAYHPVILEMRDTGVSNVQFNESGDDYFQIVDLDSEAFTAGGSTASPFDFDNPIGRDLRIEYASFELMQGAFDWAATQSGPDQHIWYNTLTHGSKEAQLAPLLDYVYDTYGPAGTNEVWVAPADEIYSYLLVRDRSVITLDSVVLISGPEPTPTLTPTVLPTEAFTQTPTLTPTLLPTVTPTALPTETPIVTATATLLPTATPTLIPTVVPTETPILVPTATLLPTETPTLTPTLLPTPTPLPADPVWTQVVTAGQPDVTDGYALAHDSTRGVTILYGGGRTWPYSQETWEFDGTSWSQIATTAVPNARYGMTLIYNSLHNKTFLFGGSDELDNELNETWEYVGGTWLQVSPAVSPPVRTGHAAAWDDANGRMLIHGGNELGIALADLWAFDGSEWVELSPINSPSARTEHTLAINSGELILYGGRLADGTLSNEIAHLELESLNWIITGNGDPGGRQKHTAVFWPDRDRFVVMGGTASASESYASLAWSFNAGMWESFADGPAVMTTRPAVAVYATDDSSSGSIIVFTGTQTWVLK
ncbi:MAG: polysaccharide deacetylase family protein [Anaerolineae bacterium]